MAHQERGTKRPRTAVGSSAAAAVEIDDMASSNFQSTLGVASIPNHKDSAATASWNSHQTNLIIFPKGSVKCFLRHFMTQKVERYSCLACQWLIPASNSATSIAQHIKHSGSHNFCPRVTKWMLKHLAVVEGVEELDMKEIVPAYVTDSSKSLQTPESSSSSNSSFLSTASPSKKMAPFRYDAVSVPQSSVFVDPSSGLDILNKIQSGNISLVTSVSRWTTPIGIKVKELCLSQVKPITVLIDIFLDAISKGALMDGYMVLKKADALRFTPRDFYPLLQYAPDRVFELVLEQDRLIYDLRYTCLAVAAAAAVTTGTPGNSTSITPPADELHVEGKVASGAEGMM
ncbi:hypothetical protein PVAP13_4KG372900 [Panicum virgatum]|uniref:Uncharacterized protein n=1 Tax=Panicum virgatum TaxID=38727 RepID=A0A8T0TVR7_PANVG|nr:hypothetical protein PVAP13_4KG372900 [Panicum virgatum]